MLAVWAEDECAICFVLTQASAVAHGKSMRLEGIIDIARGSSSVGDMVQNLSHAARG